MKKLWLALVFLFAGCGEPQDSQLKIVGGKRVEIGAWRSTVALTHPWGGAFCSGVAFNHNLIVTAAHCVRNKKPADFRVYSGSGSFENDMLGKSRVSIVEAHPLYDGHNFDIAWILLDNPLDYKASSSYVPFVKTKYESDLLLKNGKKATLVGFGIRDSGYLGEKWEVETRIIPIAPGASHNAYTEFAVGGYGSDSCQGDSGGPAYAKASDGQWRVVGITSRGQGCGNGGVYTRLQPYLCWIEETSYVSMRLPSGSCP